MTCRIEYIGSFLRPVQHIYLGTMGHEFLVPLIAFSLVLTRHLRILGGYCHDPFTAAFDTTEPISEAIGFIPNVPRITSIALLIFDNIHDSFNSLHSQ
jgi:hypothetical protein